MATIDQQIQQRKKDALSKQFYDKAQNIVQKLGNKKTYEDDTIRIERVHYEQQFTGGADNIEIFAHNQSVYKGEGNEYTGPFENDIKRYVPGVWEEAFNALAAKAVNQDKSPETESEDTVYRQQLKNDWGL